MKLSLFLILSLSALSAALYALWFPTPQSPRSKEISSFSEHRPESRPQTILSGKLKAGEIVFIPVAIDEEHSLFTNISDERSQK